MKSVHQPSSRRRRRGPRFTSEDKEVIQERIVQAAIGLVRSKGIAALTFERVAASRGLDITRTALFHYFGSRVGLLAAISEWVFNAIGTRLFDELRRKPVTPRRLVVLARAYAEFVLTDLRLYRTAHHPDLWEYSTRPDVTETTARFWIDRAGAARNRTFNVFVQAVEDAQVAGSIIWTEDIGAPDVVTLLFSVVDGYAFQSLSEHIVRTPSDRRELDYISKLVAMAISGVVEARDTDPD